MLNSNNEVPQSKSGLQLAIFKFYLKSVVESYNKKLSKYLAKQEAVKKDSSSNQLRFLASPQPKEAYNNEKPIPASINPIEELVNSGEPLDFTSILNLFNHKNLNRLKETASYQLIFKTYYDLAKTLLIFSYVYPNPERDKVPAPGFQEKMTETYAKLYLFTLLDRYERYKKNLKESEENEFESISKIEKFLEKLYAGDKTEELPSFRLPEIMDQTKIQVIRATVKEKLFNLYQGNECLKQFAPISSFANLYRPTM